MSSARKLKVFLCHSSGDKPAVRTLYQRLCADDIEPSSVKCNGVGDLAQIRSQGQYFMKLAFHIPQIGCRQCS